MEVLGSWGIANIGVGVAGWANSKGGSNKYFYQMDAIWGVVNLGIAVIGYTTTQSNKNKILSPEESLKQQQKIEQTFLINGGLDLVYLGAGAYLKHRGNTNHSAELRGYGSSVLLQGAFLLLFDATMYSAEKSNGNKLRRFIEKNPVYINGKGLGMIYHLD